jgi:hypothetical protein
MHIAGGRFDWLARHYMLQLAAVAHKRPREAFSACFP